MNSLMVLRFIKIARIQYHTGNPLEIDLEGDLEFVGLMLVRVLMTF